MQFYKEKIETILSDLKTNLKTGLSEKEVKKRLKEFGPNTLPEKKATSALIIFLRQLLSPLMFILLIATLFSVAIGEVKDAIVISIAVILNTVIGFIQEWKAEKAAAKLKSYEVAYCNVIRDEKVERIEAKNLVPGDMVVLSAGSKIPADLRLTELIDFQVDESLLTGEVKPVAKNVEQISDDVTIGDRINMAFSGTNVLSGKAYGIVVKTGVQTQLGHIAKLIGDTKQQATPLQEQIKKLSWILGTLFLIVVTLVFFLGLIKGMPFHQIIMIGIALAVSAIPEGLLVCVTVILAIGMQRMLKRHALVRHLVAAETLGSVSVICTDKTGTLTKGQMQVEEIIMPNSSFKISKLEKTKKTFLKEDSSTNKELEKILIAAVLNNDAHIDLKTKKITGNPTEIALLDAAKFFNLNIKQIQKQDTRINEIPFSSKLKYMATLNKFDDSEKIIVKGAPEKIFDMCKINELEKFKKIADKMAQEGLRILAIAEKNVSKSQNQNKDLKENLSDLNFLGLVGIKDPLRRHAKKTVTELQAAGIRVVLVTGDHKDTAANVAQHAGIIHKNGVITGKELDNLTNKQLTQKIKSIDIFARVEPKHKIRIVHAWQKHDKTVAMIGDGVNDAPALKASNIGVALGSGSDVTHEISDMVLLDNNLSTIDAAVKEGRTIFDNIRKVITYLTSDSFGEIILISLAIIFNYPIPILASQILWINLISDGFPGIALTMEPSEPEIMNEPPRRKNEPILNKEIKTIIFGTSIITDIILFLLYIYLLKTNLNYEHVRTIMFTTLSINSLFFVFSMKSFRKSIFRINLFSNAWLIVAVLFSFLAQLTIIYIPILQNLFNTVALDFFDWGIVFMFALSKTFAIEITKKFFIKK